MIEGPVPVRSLRSSAISVGAGLALWEIAGRAFDAPFLPPFSAVLRAAADLIRRGLILGPLTASVASLAIGFGGAAVTGVVTGALMGRYRIVEHLFDLYIHALLATPTLIYVPVLFTLFGVSRASQVAVVFLYAFAFVVDSTFLAVRGADRVLLDMARSFGASDRQIFWRIVVPGAWPRIAAGLRIAMGRAVKGMINGEMMIALIGLGAQVRTFGSRFEIDRLFGVLMIVLALGLVCTQLLKLLDRRMMRGLSQATARG